MTLRTLNYCVRNSYKAHQKCYCRGGGENWCYKYL